jgi:hypothetical protein
VQVRVRHETTRAVLRLTTAAGSGGVSLRLTFYQGKTAPCATLSVQAAQAIISASICFRLKSTADFGGGALYLASSAKCTKGVVQTALHRRRPFGTNVLAISSEQAVLLSAKPSALSRINC